MQITGAAEITLYWTLAGTLGINKLGARVIGTPTFGPALAVSVGAAIRSAWSANLASKMAINVGLARVGIRDLRQDNQPEYRDTAAATTGSGTGEPLPVGVAMCVTLRTAGSGKSFRGRMYLSGWDELQNDPSGQAVAAASTAATTYCAAVQTGLRAQGLEWAVLTRPSEEVIITETTNHSNGTTTSRVISHEKTKAGATHDITAFETRTPMWESQRRRMNGRGAALSLFTPVSRVDVPGPGEPVRSAPAELSASSGSRKPG